MAYPPRCATECGRPRWLVDQDRNRAASRLCRSQEADTTGSPEADGDRQTRNLLEGGRRDDSGDNHLFARAEDPGYAYSRHAQRGDERRVLIGRCYGAGVPDIAPPSCSQTFPVVTVGGPVKKPAKFCWTQSAARAVESSAPA